MKRREGRSTSHMAAAGQREGVGDEGWLRRPKIGDASPSMPRAFRNLRSPRHSMQLPLGAILLAWCCLGRAGTAQRAITVASGTVEVVNSAATLRRCGWESCTLVMQGSRVRVGGAFFPSVKHVAMGGASRLEVPRHPSFPVAMGAGDAVAVDAALRDAPGVDADDTPVCTYSGDVGAFADARCACCVEREKTRLVLNVAHHTINALTAGVWRSCDVVSPTDAQVTVTNDGMQFRVLGEMTVHGDASLLGDIEAGSLSVVPPRRTRDSRPANGTGRDDGNEPVAKTGVDESAIEGHPALQADIPDDFHCVWKDSGFDDPECKQATAPSDRYRYFLDVYAPYSMLSPDWLGVTWYYSCAEETNMVKAYSLGIYADVFYFKKVLISDYIYFKVDVRSGVIEEGSIDWVWDEPYTIEKVLFVGKSVEIGTRPQPLTVVAVPISDAWKRYTTKTANRDACTVMPSAYNGFEEFDCKTKYLDTRRIDLIANDTYDNGTAVWRNVVWNHTQADTSGTVRVETANTATVRTDAFFFTSLTAKTLVLEKTPSFGVIQSGSVESVVCSPCRDDDIYFLTQSLGTPPGDLDKYDVGNGYYRVMKAGHGHFRCTRNADGFVEWDCAHGLVGTRMMELVVNARFETTDTWGSIEYKPCNEWSGVWVTEGIFETACAAFRFDRLVAAAIYLNSRPQNTTIVDGDADAVSCTPCSDTDVLFVTDSFLFQTCASTQIGAATNRITKVHSSNCTWSGAAFREFDCQLGYAAAEHMVLVAKSPFTSLDAEWKDAIVETCSTSRSSLRAKTVTATCGVLSFESLTTKKLTLKAKPTDALIVSGTVTNVFCGQCTPTSPIFVGRDVDVGPNIRKAQIAPSAFRFMFGEPHTTCTYATGGFVEFDCKTYADPAYMDLVVRATYTSSAGPWKTATVDACSAGPLSVWTRELVTACTTFSFENLTADSVSIGSAPTAASIENGNIGGFSCTRCQTAAVLFVGKAVTVPSSFSSVEIGNGMKRYTLLADPQRVCTVRSRNGVFDEFDCELTVAEKQAWVDFTQMDLLVNCTGSPDCVVSKPFGSATFRRIVVASDFTSLTFTVPVTLTSFIVGQNTKEQALTMASVTADTVEVASSVAEQCDIPVMTVESFVPSARFRSTSAKKYNYLFTSRTPVTAKGLVSHKMSGVYRVSNSDTPSHCTFVRGCEFVEADCTAFSDDLRTMTVVFAADTAKLTCASLRFSSISYTALAITSTGPVVVESLAVDGMLSGSFVVNDEMSFVAKDTDVGTNLAITAGRGVSLVVTKNGEPVPAAETPVFLFTGSVSGDVPMLRGATCGGVTYWAYTPAPSVPCTCWVRGDNVSSGYSVNWCGPSFALGVRRGTLVFDKDSPYISNGIDFGTDSVTLATNTSKYTIELDAIDAPDTLVVERGVVLAVETINAGRVIRIDTLVTGSVHGGRVRIVQANETLDVTIRHLDGRVVVSGSDVTMRIAGCTAGSRVDIDGGVFLEMGGDVKTVADTAPGDVGVVVSMTESSVLSCKVHGDALAVIVGDGVSYTVGDDVHVSLNSSSPCRGRNVGIHTQPSALAAPGQRVLHATTALDMATGARTSVCPAWKVVRSSPMNTGCALGAPRGYSQSLTRVFHVAAPGGVSMQATTCSVQTGR